MDGDEMNYFLSALFDVDSDFALLSFLPESFPESFLLSESDFLLSDSPLELEPEDGFLA